MTWSSLEVFYPNSVGVHRSALRLLLLPPQLGKGIVPSFV
jgi:hypothetical protein